MKRSVSLFAALLLAPVLGSAQSIESTENPIPFNDGIMTQAMKFGKEAGVQNIGRLPIELIKCRVNKGPGDTYPNLPPHLTDQQVTDLLGRMDAIDTANGPGSLNHNELNLVGIGLTQIDILYVQPISTQQWDSILKLMGDTAAKDYPQNHDWNTTIDDMLAAAMKSLKDPHSDYWNPQQAKEFTDEMSGSEVGIGVTISLDPKGMKIETMFPGSGAKTAGLESGDIVIAADGKSLAGMALGDMVNLVRGAANTQVSLTILRGGQTLTVVVTRSRVQIPQILAKMETDQIGYVYLSQFGDNSADQVIASVGSLRAQGAKALILDLRGNPGGEVTQVASIASEFLKDGQTIVTFKHQGEMADQYVTDGDGKFVNLPIVVLVDKNSASASEIMASAMQDLRAGMVIVGTHSYGKGSEQSLLSESDGSMLHITVNHNYRPNGQDIDANHDPKTGVEIYGTGGVEPNVVVPVDDKQESQILEGIFDQMLGEPAKTQAQDPALQKAVQILNQNYI